MRFVPHLFGLTFGSVLLACSSTPATTTTITRPELVAVSPDDFLGTQHCGDGPELVGSYVATLFDVTTQSDGGPTPEYGFPLPSSPATACEFQVTFSLVLAGHRYRAEIDAYDRRPKTNDPNPNLEDAGADADAGPSLPPITAVSLGGRLQQDVTGAHVAPRWTALCGGYPATIDDAGTDAGDAGADAGDAAPPGVVSHDTLTSTVHYCPGGLQPVK